MTQRTELGRKGQTEPQHRTCVKSFGLVERRFRTCVYIGVFFQTRCSHNPDATGNLRTRPGDRRSSQRSSDVWLAHGRWFLPVVLREATEVQPDALPCFHTGCISLCSNCLGFCKKGHGEICQDTPLGNHPCSFGINK